MPKPTIVLVHGAWADGSSWNAVSTELQGQGFTVLTPPNLLHGVAGDAAYVASFLAQRTTGPVVLVGHSYGGVVITNAGPGGGDVRALVYVDAFIPEVGETTFQILGGSGSAFDVPDPNAVFDIVGYPGAPEGDAEALDRKSTRLNSSHPSISYAVFCLKKKKNKTRTIDRKKKTKQNKQTMRDQHVEKIEEEAHVNGLVHLRHITGRVIMSNASIVAALR